MDWVTWKQEAGKHLQKYKYAALLLLLGIFLMTLPEKKPTSPAPPPEPAPATLQQSLSRILARVEGAGKVEVLLTEAAGERILFQTDEDSKVSETTEDVRSSTVLVTTASRDQTGLVQQTIPPIYQGAIVLCQGADRAQVRLSMVEAVKSVTGLSADKITVLKMK